MNVLQHLTSQQIQAFTPECLKVLLEQNTRLNDIVVLEQNTRLDDIVLLKYYFTQLKYDGRYNNAYTAKYNEHDASKMRQILLKYSSENFYLTCVEVYNPTHSYNYTYHQMYNYKLHTFDEIKTILPTGVDINKVCFSGIKNTLACIKWPEGYDKQVEGSGISYIPQLLHYHDNLHIVHPTLLEMAKYFYNET
jgi:hypothetical protein